MTQKKLIRRKKNERTNQPTNQPTKKIYLYSIGPWAKKKKKWKL